VFWKPNKVRRQIDVLDLRALQYIDDRLPDLLQLGQQLVDVRDGMQAGHRRTLRRRAERRAVRRILNLDQEAPTAPGEPLEHHEGPRPAPVALRLRNLDHWAAPVVGDGHTRDCRAVGRQRTARWVVGSALPTVFQARSSLRRWASNWMRIWLPWRLVASGLSTGSTDDRSRPCKSATTLAGESQRILLLRQSPAVRPRDCEDVAQAVGGGRGRPIRDGRVRRAGTCVGTGRFRPFARSLQTRRTASVLA
jgi:hypothetical protein